MWTGKNDFAGKDVYSQYSDSKKIKLENSED